MINFLDNIIAFFFPNAFDKHYRKLIDFIENSNSENQQAACEAVCNIQCESIPLDRKDDAIHALLVVMLRLGVNEEESSLVAIGAAIRKILLNISQDEIPSTCAMIFSLRNDKNKNIIDLEASKIIRQIFNDKALSNHFVGKYDVLSNDLINIFNSIPIQKLQIDVRSENSLQDFTDLSGAIAINSLLAWTLLDHNDKQFQHYETKQKFFEVLFDQYPNWFSRLFVSRIKRESIPACKKVLEQQGFNKNINLLNKLMFLNMIVAIYNEKNDEH